MASNPVSSELQAKIEEWLAWDKNETTKEEINALVSNGQVDTLEKILLQRMAFGTAGLRGKMAAGYACMNDLVIIQTAQGWLKYLIDHYSQLLKENGIVIGYDGRHNSKRYAELSAAVFLHQGFPVKLFSSMVPTPFVPFAVSKWKCAAGVMVTASHNPKEDNGYKVYASNGSQIIPPADKTISKHILDNLNPLESSWDTSIVESSSLVEDPLMETLNDYMQIISENIIDEHRTTNSNTTLNLTYTAMHGVGYNYIVKGMSIVGLKVIPVRDQIYPDPDFPTVKFPNPEEGKSCLDLAIKTADEYDSAVILANDPDADRLAIAERNRAGEWRIFNGNEIGALLGWWQLYTYRKRFPKEPLANIYMLASTVSSKILRSMARKEGFNFVETLTGFKWMGNKAFDLTNEGKKVIFAYEEAIGFMCGDSVLDKDGVSAAVVVGTMAAHLYTEGLRLADRLEIIYKEYGQHVSNNSYFICHDVEKIRRIFDRLRNWSGPNSYPDGILNGKYTVTSTRDLTTGYDNSQPDNKAVLPTSKSSQMITFEFDNGLVTTLRTSGTEPKIKYYTELCASPSQTDRKQIENILSEMVEALVDEFLQPKENALILRPE